MNSPKCNQLKWISIEEKCGNSAPTLKHEMQQPQLKSIQQQVFIGDNNFSNQEICKNKQRKATITKIVKMDYSPRRSRKSKFSESQSESESNTLLTNVITKHGTNPSSVDIAQPKINDSTSKESNLPDLQSNFLKKKIDRNKCTDELQNYLSEHLNIENKTDDTDQPDNKPLDNGNETVHSNQLELISTDKIIQLSSNEENLTKKETDKCIPLKSPPIKENKIAEKIIEKQPPPPRSKSYDPIKARQYMQEQKKKRLVQFKSLSSGVNNRVQKEENQKRLAKLKENSLKIVANNLKHIKTKKSQVSGSNSSIGNAKEKYESRSALALSRKPISNLSLKRKSTTSLPDSTKNVLTKPSTKPLNCGAITFQQSKPQKPDGIDTGKPSVIIMPKTKENIDPNKIKSTNELSKRIGILRRSEVDVAPKTPPQNLSANSKIRDIGDKPFPPSKTVVEKLSELTSPLFSIGIENEFALTVPPSMQSLRSSNALQKSASSISSTSTKSSAAISHKSMKTIKNRHKSIPYWLKPTPVHPYPYNFIMAVRKKLESISKNQVTTENRSKRQMNFDKLDNKEQTPVARPKYFRRTNSSNFRQNLANTKIEPQLRSQEMLATLDAIPQLQMPAPVSPKVVINKLNDDNINSLEKSIKPISSMSDLNTNFSSITLHISGTNTTSDFSSLISDGKKNVQQIPAADANKSKEQMRNDDDDATLSVSSTIFSQSSPEKKKLQFPVQPPIPLSTENIDHLQVSAKKKTLSDMPFVKMERGSEISKEFQQINRQSSEHNDNGSEINQTRIIEMLETFNKSLSQVISVNKQLHTALSKQPKDRTDLQKSSSSNNEYNSQSFHSSATNKTIAEQLYSSTFNTHDQSSSIHQSTHSNQNDKESSQTENKISHSITKHSSNDSSNNKLEPIKSNSNSELLASSRHSKSKTLVSIQENPSQSNRTNFTSTQHNTIQSTEKSSSIPSEIIRTDSNKTVSDQLSEKNSNQLIDQSKHSSSAVETIVESSSKNLSKTEENCGTTICEDQFSVKSLAQHSLTAAGGGVGEQNSTVGIELNTSMGSDVYAIFNQTDIEFSMLSTNDNNQTIISEGNVSYSSIGMYEQMIKTETQKGDHLASIIKLREKALINRTKGQIAWLELQKQQYKKNGQIIEMSSTKKKQRALLVRLEKERTEMHKLAKINGPSSSATAIKSPPKFKLNHLNNDPNVSLQRRSRTLAANVQQSPSQSGNNRCAMKGYEISGTAGLEDLLLKREQELEKRRVHVEQLLKWQQRLDREERDVIEMERKIMKNVAITQHRSKTNIPHTIYFDNTTTNNILNTSTIVMSSKVSSDHNQSHDSSRSYRKIKEIESSLSVLQNIPLTTSSNENDYVSTSGHKLNKLWRRLTGESADKFNSTQQYHLCKNDLEQIYEEAKSVVLMRFNSSTDDVLNGLEKTIIETTKNNQNDNESVHESIETIVKNQSISNNQYFDEDSLNSIANIEQDGTTVVKQIKDYTDVAAKSPIVPLLNLNFSPEPPSVESEIGTVLSDEGGYYLSAEKQHENVEKNDEQKIVSSPGINSENDNENLTTSIVNESSDTVIYSQIESTSTPIIEQNAKGVSKLQLPLNEESLIMIEDVSFPNINITINDNDDINDAIADCANNEEEINAAITFTIDNDDNDQQKQQYNQIKETQTVAATLECDDKEYLSDDFDSDDKTIPTICTTPSKCLSDTESKINSESNHTATILTITEDLNFECTNDKSLEQEKFKDNNVILDKSSESSDDSSSSSSESCSNSYTTNSSEIKSKELEKRLIDIDESLKDINDTIDKAPVMELCAKSPSPERSIKSPQSFDTNSISPSSSLSSSSSSDDSNKENENSNQQLNCVRELPGVSVIASTGQVLPLPSIKTIRNFNGFEAVQSTSSIPAPPPPPMPVTKSIDDSEKGNAVASSLLRDYVSPSSEYKIPNKMPDIISEAEVLRRQQLQIEQEIKQLEQTVPLVYLREIPNKPPPPYVPPAHGSPMTTIFPSNGRIKEIIFRRISELYTQYIINNEPIDEIPQLSNTSSSILDEKITNIYERIILDICKECFADIQIHLPNSPTYLRVQKYKSPLAFYNPPDRLLCIQEFALKRIKNLLNVNGNLGQLHHAAACSSRRKRDVVDEILIQELMEDESKWTNFDIEEMQVLNDIANDTYTINNITQDAEQSDEASFV